jgi:hypothetical protein
MWLLWQQEPSMITISIDFNPGARDREPQPRPRAPIWRPNRSDFRKHCITIGVRAGSVPAKLQVPR